MLSDVKIFRKRGLKGQILGKSGLGVSRNVTESSMMFVSKDYFYLVLHPPKVFCLERFHWNKLEPVVINYVHRANFQLF